MKLRSIAGNIAPDLLQRVDDLERRGYHLGQLVHEVAQHAQHLFRRPVQSSGLKPASASAV